MAETYHQQSEDFGSDQGTKRPLDTSTSTSDESADEFGSPTLPKRMKFDNFGEHDLTFPVY